MSAIKLPCLEPLWSKASAVLTTSVPVPVGLTPPIGLYQPVLAQVHLHPKPAGGAQPLVNWAETQKNLAFSQTHCPAPAVCLNGLPAGLAQPLAGASAGPRGPRATAGGEYWSSHCQSPVLPTAHPGSWGTVRASQAFSCITLHPHPQEFLPLLPSPKFRLQIALPEQ